MRQFFRVKNGGRWRMNHTRGRNLRGKCIVCLSSGSVPHIWKQANVTPINKKNDPSDVSNYRPISLLSAVRKVLEKLCINTFSTSFETITSLHPFNPVLSKVILL